MGMIRRADLDQVTRQATVMDLSDLRVRGEAIISEATREAERILAEAKAERERLLAGAESAGHAEGLKKGLAEGREAGRKDGVAEARKSHDGTIATLCEAWRTALDAFEGSRDGMLSEARREVVTLAIEIASRVVRRAIEVDPEAVLPQIEAVLAAVSRPTRLLVRVHPEDLEIARREMPSIVERFEQCRHADLVADASLARGSCVATTEDGGRIDAEINAQMGRIVAELLPDGGPAKGLRVEPDTRSDAA